MNPAIRHANHERGFHPAIQWRGMICLDHAKQPKQWRFRLAQGHRTPAYDFQSGCRRRRLNSFPLRGRRDLKNTRKNSSRIQAWPGGGAIIGNVASGLKTARDLLWMISHHTGSRREIRRAAQNQVELLVWRQNRSVAKITVTDLVAVIQSIPASRFSGKAHAFRLRFDCNKPCSRQAPCGNHSHRAQSAAKIEDISGAWTTHCAVPGGQDVIGRKSVTLGQLKEPEITADGVESFTRFQGRAAPESSGRYRAGLGPSFKRRFSVIISQALKVGICRRKHNPLKTQRVSRDSTGPPQVVIPGSAQSKPAADPNGDRNIGWREEDLRQRKCLAITRGIEQVGHQKR